MKIESDIRLRKAIRNNSGNHSHYFIPSDHAPVRLSECCFIPFNIELEIGLAILETITIRKENELHLQN